MATSGYPAGQHVPYDSFAAQRTPHDYVIAQQILYTYQKTPQDEKYNTPIASAVVEVPPPTRNGENERKKYYVPAALRTSLLLAFCVFTLIVFALLQVGAAAYVGAHGLESLVQSPSSEKRAAYPQSSTPAVCAPDATCAPNQGSWSNPNQSTPNPGAPAGGSWSSAGSTYFLGAYVPTLVAISFSIWWKCILARLTEMEPFHQLTKPGGASAKDSLLLSYSGSMLPVVLLKSFRSRHWLTLIGTVNMGLITICTLFAAETLYLRGVGDGCGVIVNATGEVNGHCYIELAMRPTLGFVLGVLLFVVVLLTLLAIKMLRRSPSGIFAEATSIAGIASLASPKLSREARLSHGDASRRYALAYSHVDGMNSIIDLQPLAPPPSALLPDPLQIVPSRFKRESHWEMYPFSLTLFLLFQAGVLILILHYRFVSEPGTNNGLEDFMNSESFGVRLFMTMLGLGTKFYWGWIEKYVCHMSPYLSLASPHGAAAEQSVLFKSQSHPITALFKSSTWKKLLVGIVTLMAALSEVLVITLNAVPFTRATAYLAFKISVYISTIILALMILTMLSVLLWQMRIKKRLEVLDVPACIADIFELVGERQGWSALSTLNGKERDRVVKDWGERFAIKKIQGRWQIVLVRPGEGSA